MEVVSKHRLGKLPEGVVLAQSFEASVGDEGFAPLSISLRHATVARGLRIVHKNPFDRFLIAQALIENIPIVSNEQMFESFG